MNVIIVTIRGIRINDYLAGNSTSLVQIIEGLLITIIGDLDGPL